MPRPAGARRHKRLPNAPSQASEDIRGLFSFQLQQLAGLSTRIAALSMRPRFGVTPREWRALAVLSYLDEAPLQELARQAGLLKSQMSRTVSTLIDRGLIQRSANPADGRSVLLRLTPTGRTLADAIFVASQERNERMLAALSSDERQVLSALLGRVFRTSLSHLAEAKRLAGGSIADEEPED